ncbi:hypothetical protein GALMADRAFT_880609 [Galerina marginata CBS 339.88]|uniref:Uncharacterized protein n=1 Tax=Galerina marginata (strain CBS 339.88) TaxID=685588 RepID=A0A067SIC4_GALM3|nr:hypothetical protein GALMADRAFT_880609 [Galerina marginata CBS 339.88]
MLLQYTDQIHLNPHIEKFVRTLVSVQELQTMPLTFISLLNIQTHTTTPILPSLRVINLVDDVNTHLPHVADFINARTQLGISADTLVVRVPSEMDVESFRKSVPGVNTECHFHEF